MRWFGRPRQFDVKASAGVLLAARPRRTAFTNFQLMESKQIENTIVDEANRRTYVILAPRVLTDGEIYRVIRQEILRRRTPLADGETITLTVTSTGGRITSVVEPDPPKEPLSPAAPGPNETGMFHLPACSI